MNPTNLARKREREKAIDNFAELLSDGCTTTQAAQAIGRSVSWSEAALKQIREGLGWQAK